MNGKTIRILAEDRLAAIGALSAGLSHEMNNPLAAIVLNLRLALQEIEDIEKKGASRQTLAELRAEVSDALDAADRLGHLVKDVRRFSRGEEDPSGPVDVARVISASTRLAASAVRGRARLTKDIPPLPPVLVSEALLAQLFLALIFRAVHAIPDGSSSEDHEIHISAAHVGDRVLVWFEDSGEPLEASHPGLRSGRELRARELAVCQAIARALGGELSVSNGLRHGYGNHGEGDGAVGTTLTVALPARR